MYTYQNYGNLLTLNVDNSGGGGGGGGRQKPPYLLKYYVYIHETQHYLITLHQESWKRAELLYR